MSTERSIADAVQTGSLTQCERELLGHLEAAVDKVFTTMLSTVCELVEGTTAPHAPALSNVSIEAVVGFSGPAHGAVVLRCSPEGAADIARGLLMLGEGDTVELAEVRDALGECANMVTGALKTRALDPHGDFRLTVPTIDTCVSVPVPHHGGRLVYKLAQGSAAIEIWLA
ncbi:MAG: chemotaxis protein CheX [Planctomycetes bacterium]|nr:chemotaxis protein CheX [Planctomycetota bacterium]